MTLLCVWEMLGSMIRKILSSQKGTIDAGLTPFPAALPLPPLPPATKRADIN